jgi:hypothetical protein
MSEISDEELKKLLKNLGALDEVPKDVAARLDATIERWVAEEKSKRRSRLNPTSWSLAAGFTLIFGLGIVLNLDLFPISQAPSTSTTESIEKNADDVLTSTGNEPMQVVEPAPKYSSGIDYSKAISIGDLPFKPEVNFGTLSDLDSNTRSCLTSLGFKGTVSVVDFAFYGNQKVTAVWSALSVKSWIVSIVSPECQGVNEVLVNE